MDPKTPKIWGGTGPEGKIRSEIKKYLENLHWYVLVTTGNKYQSGFPDLYVTHKTYGARWIEVKRPHMEGSKFTPAQLDVFPKLCANGSGVWILTAATRKEYMKLFKDCNWWQYLQILRIHRRGQNQ